MGLDMYLYAEKYVGGVTWSRDLDDSLEPEPNEQFDKVLDVLGAQNWGIDRFASASVSVQVGYWRKANAIHNWFVDGLAGGRDECQSIYVPRDSLRALQITCELLLENKDVALAKQVLPTQAGFFFGSTEYDEWYWQSVQDTYDQMKRILEVIPEDVDFQYQASW